MCCVVVSCDAAMVCYVVGSCGNGSGNGGWWWLLWCVYFSGAVVVV